MVPETQSICPPGKPYSVPACVEEVPGQKRKRKGAAKLQDFHQWYLATCEWVCGLGQGRRGRRGLGLAPDNPALLQMLTMLIAGGSGKRARPLQVRLGP